MRSYDFRQTKVFVKKIQSRKNLKDVFHFLKSKKKTVSFAESCTGGLLSSLMVSRAGASEIFKGGLVCYSNSIKEEILGVSSETLQKKGAVSEECVREMALCCSRLFQTQVSVSLSGISGPSGGVKEKPVGTVWIAVNIQNNMETFCFHFSGSRNRVRLLSARAALFLLAQTMRKNENGHIE